MKLVTRRDASGKQRQALQRSAPTADIRRFTVPQEARLVDALYNLHVQIRELRLGEN